MIATSEPRVGVIVVAAGSGARLGLGAKAFVSVRGRSILAHSLDAVCGSTALRSAQLVVVAPGGAVAEAQEQVRQVVTGVDASVTVVAGGASRQESVAAGLAALDAAVQIVLIHDAARALTPPEVFERVVAAIAAGADAVIPVMPVVDTLKKISGAAVVGTADRRELVAAQTPQGFDRAALDRSYQLAAEEYTDDAALVAAAGLTVGTVSGSERSFKITTPADLERARRELEPGPAETRVGVGADVHAFSDHGTLWLAGLPWPGETALSGHSDGDVAAHAIVDAVLAAAGLGDIGTHFGVAQPQYADAHAEVFLAETVRLIAEHGWRIVNVAVQVQANRPRLGQRRVEAQQALSAALDGAPVSVSATTTDGLGFTGRGEGIAAFAVAQLSRSGRSG